jgi:hypothetical protein
MNRNSGRAFQGRGRQGRGRYQGRGKPTRKPKDEKVNKNTAQLMFQVGTAKQASEYTRIKKYCINFMSKTYEQGHYIATAIEDGKDYDFSDDKPEDLKLVDEEIGSAGDRLLAKSRNESAKIDYDNKLNRYNDKLEKFKENKFKACAHLWEKCSTQMKQGIEAKENYSADIKHNPYNLMKAIESLSYNYQESKYEMAIIFDALKTFFTLQQKDDKKLTDYLDRFKAAASNM